MRILLAVSFLFVSSTSLAETLAKTETYVWTLSLELIGTQHSDECELDLVADTYRKTYRTSLKNKYYFCSLFGPKQLIAMPIERYTDFLVISEAAIGGDGDHTGPILRFYRLNSEGLKKIAEKEVFDATYHRIGGNFERVTGLVLFSFCSRCDGPDVAEPKDRFFVPVRMTLGCGGLCISTTLAASEKAKLIKRFNRRKVSYLSENGIEGLPERIVRLEQDFLNALR